MVNKMLRTWLDSVYRFAS